MIYKASLLFSFFLLPVSAINLNNTIWNTNWNVMSFWQNGNQVSAEYMYDGGIITGTLSGDTLHGWWRENDNAKGCGPENSWSGPLVFKFSADGKSFTGTWDYCGADPSTLDPNATGWTGTIKDGIVAYTQKECEDAGRFWCNNECKLAPCDSVITKQACEKSGRFWCSDTCQMTPCNVSPVKRPVYKQPSAQTKRSPGINILTGAHYDLRGNRIQRTTNGINIYVDGSGHCRTNLTILH